VPALRRGELEEEHLMGAFGKCRSCNRGVYWARTAANNKPIPLEEAPETGNVLIDGDGRAHVLKDNAAARAALAGVDVERDVEFGATVYLSHYATCPQADAWRGNKRQDADAPAAPPAAEEPLF
jgi:hypothetical protein